MKALGKVYIAGHRGMVGAALVRRFEEAGASDILTATRTEVDLANQAAVRGFFETERPDTAVIAAAKVGGILANDTYPAEFLYENLAIAGNVIHAAYEVGVKRLLFLGSSCIYPKHADQPIDEDSLLTAPLEPTNEAYAVAKIAGLKLCQYYRKQYGVLFHSAMPTNLYGPGDNYHPDNSHVVPGLIRRFHEAKEKGDPVVTVWGSGTPRREFMYVDDLADACLFLMGREDPPDWINVGTGSDVTISELAGTIRQVVGYEGELAFDSTKPDGTPRKLMDSKRIHGLGWRHSTQLAAGLERAYAAYLDEGSNRR